MAGVSLATDFGKALNADDNGTLRSLAVQRLEEAITETRSALNRGVRPNERPALEAKAHALERAHTIVQAACDAIHS